MGYDATENCCQYNIRHPLENLIITASYLSDFENLENFGTLYILHPKVTLKVVCVES